VHKLKSIMKFQIVTILALATLFGSFRISDAKRHKCQALAEKCYFQLLFFAPFTVCEPFIHCEYGIGGTVYNNPCATRCVHKALHCERGAFGYNRRFKCGKSGYDCLEACPKSKRSLDYDYDQADYTDYDDLKKIY